MTKPTETQATVAAKMKELFPQFDTPAAHVSSLLEENFELAFAEGILPGDIVKMMWAVFDKTIRQSLSGEGKEEPSAEAGDLLICLLTYAQCRGFDLQEALEEKMTIIRSHDPAYYAAKHAAKVASGHVLPALKEM